MVHGGALLAGRSALHSRSHPQSRRRGQRRDVGMLHDADMLILALAAALAGTLAWPVPSHEVVRAFDAPDAPWGAGHRGIDIAAAAGGPVLAPADGTVWFAGVVVDRPVLSIEHAGGVLTSFEPVEPLVERGDAVVAGQVVATLLPGHRPCGTCLHMGVRIDGEYVNPLLLLGAERAVLLPLDRGAVTASGPGMGGAIGIGEALEGHVGVDLRRAEARVPEDLLHRAQVGATVEQVRRGRMPQRVRARGP